MHRRLAVFCGSGTAGLGVRGVAGSGDITLLSSFRRAGTRCRPVLQHGEEISTGPKKHIRKIPAVLQKWKTRFFCVSGTYTHAGCAFPCGFCGRMEGVRITPCCIKEREYPRWGVFLDVERGRCGLMATRRRWVRGSDGCCTGMEVTGAPGWWCY